jgi:cupin fold WbuC family metalloprotein
MTPARPINDEVFVAQDPLVTVDQDCIEDFKQQAARTSRHRARLCAHKSIENRIHEMFIALTKDAYIRPHRHINKSESFLVIEGTATVVFFDDDGKIERVVEIGDYLSGKPFYYRNEDERFHTQIVTSERLVFHETTNGPFNRADTVLASWSPEETDIAAVKEYSERLRKEASEFRRPKTRI